MFKTIVANAFLGEFGALTIVSTEGLKTGTSHTVLQPFSEFWLESGTAQVQGVHIDPK